MFIPIGEYLIGARLFKFLYIQIFDEQTWATFIEFSQPLRMSFSDETEQEAPGK